MQISILLAQQIAQLFLILIMGYAVVKAGLLKASDSKVLSVVMVYLVTPCVIINAFQINDTPEIRKGLLYSMAIAAAIHVVLLGISALLSRPLKLDAVEQVNVIYSNAAALVIPLVRALLGDEYVIYSCAFIIVQLILLWTHASSLLQGDRALDWKKVFSNINMIAIAAGALLYWFRVALPAPLQNTMSTMGDMIGPMGMLLAGMAIASSPLKKLVLYDIDPDRLELVDTLCGSLIAKLDPECVYFTTTDPEKAYTDIDFAFAQIRQGGMEMREKDEKISLEERLVRTANKDFVTTEVEPMWDAADVMRMGKDLFIQHGLTTNRTAMDWFQRYYPEHRVHAVNFPGDPYPIHIDATFVPLRPGLIINNPQRKLPEEQRAIFEANDWQIVDAAQPAHSEPPEFCYSSVWLSMNCLVLDPKTVIVEASEVYQQEEMDKLGMNVIPVDLRGAYAFGGGLHCSTADVYREGECLDYFPNRVADPTLVRPEMWND